MSEHGRAYKARPCRAQRRRRRPFRCPRRSNRRVGSTSAGPGGKLRQRSSQRRESGRCVSKPPRFPLPSLLLHLRHGGASSGEGTDAGRRPTEVLRSVHGDARPSWEPRWTAGQPNRHLSFRGPPGSLSPCRGRQPLAPRSPEPAMSLPAPRPWTEARPGQSNGSSWQAPLICMRELRPLRPNGRANGGLIACGCEGPDRVGCRSSVDAAGPRISATTAPSWPPSRRPSS
jgi:hypothetical protein